MEERNLTDFYKCAYGCGKIYPDIDFKSQQEGTIGRSFSFNVTCPICLEVDSLEIGEGYLAMILSYMNQHPKKELGITLRHFVEKYEKAETNPKQVTD